MNSYNKEENEYVPTIMNWLKCEWLRFIQRLTDNEYEKCKTSSGLLEVLSELEREEKCSVIDGSSES